MLWAHVRQCEGGAPMPARTALASVVATVGFSLWTARAPAAVKTDGTLGHAPQALAGPNFTLLPSQGRLVGGNLFHSFETFDLNKGERATFTATGAAEPVHN